MRLLFFVVFSIFLIGIFASQETLAQINTGVTLHHSLGDIAVDPISNTIFVSTAGGGQGYGGVFVFDGQTQEMIDLIGLEGKNIRAIAVNPNSKMLYVGYSQTSFKEGADTSDFSPENIHTKTAIDVIDLYNNSIVETIPTVDSPTEIAVNLDTNLIFVSISWRDILTVIDGNTNSIIKNIPMGVFPDAISIDQNTNTVYVAINSGGSSSGDNRIFVVDGQSLETKKILHLGNRHTGIGVNPTTNLVYVSNFGSFNEINNILSVFDAKTFGIKNEIKVGKQPTNIRIDPKSNLIYVQNFGDNSVSIIDGNSNQVVSEIPIGKFRHEGLAVNPNSGLAYVGQGINVHVIDGKTFEVSVIETKEKELSTQDIGFLIWSSYETEILLFFAILGLTIFSIYIIQKRKSKTSSSKKYSPSEMSNKKPVKLKWQIILCIIPFGWIFAYHEIQKLKMGVIIFLVTYGMLYLSSILLPWPFNVIPAAVITLSIQIYYVIKWSKEWNERFQSSINSKIP